MGSTGDVGMREGSLKLVFCCSSEDKSERLALVEQSEQGLWAPYLVS